MLMRLCILSVGMVGIVIVNSHDSSVCSKCIKAYSLHHFAFTAPTFIDGTTLHALYHFAVIALASICIRCTNSNFVQQIALLALVCDDLHGCIKLHELPQFAWLA